MSFLRRLFRSPGSVDDPVLGRLVLRDGQWTGQARWAHSAQPFALTVHRGSEAPSETERAAYLALVRDYPMLRPALQLALDRLWSDARGTIDPPPPDFGGSLGLWSRMALQGLALHPDGRLDLVTASTMRPASKARSSSGCRGRRSHRSNSSSERRRLQPARS